MDRCELIEKYYTAIKNYCKLFTKDWEDLSHDIVEYLLTCKADVIEIHSRDKLNSYIFIVARNMSSNKKYNLISLDSISEMADDIIDVVDVNEIINKLSLFDTKLLSIFAQGASVREVSRKTFISKNCLRKHLKNARNNAKRIIEDL